MKKRIVCVLLTLIMMLSLVPMGASAASHTTSEAAITVLKQMTKYEANCYHYSGTEFRTGYGTVCEGEHVFGTDGKPKNPPAVVYNEKGDKEYKAAHTLASEKDADLALRKALLALDEKVCSFASANGLSLAQNQHDALVVFSFNAGTEWMSGNGVLKSVIVNGGTANELLNAMNQWTKNENASIDRRRVEVNMYMNGIYSNTAPSTYGQVTYNANTGFMPQSNVGSGDVYTYQFDMNVTMAHPVIPTKNGNVFLGWYTQSGSTLSWVPVLRDFCNNVTLYAQWQSNSATYNNAKTVSYELAKSYLFSLNAYDMSTKKANEDWTKALNEELTKNGTVRVDRDFIDAEGNRWSRIAGGTKGWVKVGTHTGSSAEVYVDVIVTVTNTRLNSRVNATISSATNGSYSKGDQLRIINTEYADGFLWGQVAKSTTDATPIGWVALMYTNWNSVKDGGSSGSTANGSVIGTATVTFDGYLNLRSEPGTDGKIVGALAKNDTVDLYEITTVNGHQWGRSKSGWLCLTYCRVILKDNVKISDAGALVYAFTGTSQKDQKVYVEAGDNSNYVTYSVPHATDYKGDSSKADLTLPNGTAVTLTNLYVVKNDETWAKATWQNPEWEWQHVNGEYVKGDIKVTRSGWVKLNSLSSGNPGNIKLDPVSYTVVADSVNVRDYYGDASGLSFTLNKGVTVQVDNIALLSENIWGHISVKKADHVGTEQKMEGYVNLASKYFSRDNVPTIEQTTNTGLIATVINTDALKVRSTGASYGTKIGTLARGTTVAVWESNDDGWYKVDSNQNGTYDYEDDGWCSGTYLDVRKGTIGGTTTVTGSNGTKYETDGTGKGIIANTYAGVNVRTGPSTGYASNGKLLPGTVVEILETANAGKWGRVTQGWICMDYVTMISYNEVVNTPAGGTTVDSYDKAEKTTTTAIYTGVLKANTQVLRNPTKDTKNAEVIRSASGRENVTVYELAKVTEVIVSEETQKADDPNTTITTTTSVTTYWARINDGWIENPETCLSLDALDEKVHTQTGVSKLNVRRSPDESADNVMDVLVQGDQVKVTALQIIKDKVWGRIDTTAGTGWIRLDYMSEGAVYVQKPTQNTTTAPTAPVLGNTSSVGGYVNNTSGYRYTGKVIRANEVNVRANPSTTAAKTTSLKNGAALVVYETTVAENMAWGRCDAGWIYLYYVDLTPAVNGTVDARVVYNDNTIIYTDVNCSAVAGTYARMSVIDVYEIVGKMVRTDLGWVNVDDLL